MFRSAVVSALVLPILLAAAQASAEMVRDLYAARVPVTAQSSAALATASREALARVLVKVSGAEDVLDNPVIARALPDARRHVQQYAYEREKPSTGQPDGKLWARFTFEPDYVTGLIAEAGAPLWTANRPSVLAWVVLEEGQGRRFVNVDDTPELAEVLQREFARRGVPLRLPLFDLADRSALSTEQAWRLDAASLRGASARYGVQHIAVARLTSLSGGTWLGDWTYLLPEERLDRAVSSAEPGAFMRQGAAIVATEMAARYAVAPVETATGGVTMGVSGVTDYADYAALVSWLQSLELVDHANVERVRGDHVELRLWAQADASQLATLIQLNRRLVPVAEAGAGQQLSYQWQK